ncbi:MAG: hypothetical protein ABI647_02015 [Gemmatimonadota bacterium]
MRASSFLVLVLIAPSASRPIAAQTVRRIAPGDVALNASRLHPHADTARIEWTRDGATRAGPAQIEELDHTVLDGKPAWRHRIRVEGGRFVIDDTTWYEAKTLRPIRHHSHGPAGYLTVDYSEHRAVGTLDSSGRVTRHDVDLPGGAFDPSTLHPMIRSLPLGPGAVFVYPVLSTDVWTVRSDTIRVEGADSVATGAGFVPTWRLAILAAGRRATYYVRQDDGLDLEVHVDVGPGTAMRIRKSGVK